MNKHMLLAALLAVFGVAGAAHADDDCEVPMERWQPRDAVAEAVGARGWQVGRIKIDDGCYEITGTDARGAAFKAKLDPGTLDVVEMKRRDGRDGERRDHDEDDEGDDDGRDRGRERQQGAAPAAPPLSLPPPGGLLGNGAPPAVVVR